MLSRRERWDILNHSLASVSRQTSRVFFSLGPAWLQDAAWLDRAAHISLPGFSPLAFGIFERMIRLLGTGAKMGFFKKIYDAVKTLTPLRLLWLFSPDDPQVGFFETLLI